MAIPIRWFARVAPMMWIIVLLAGPAWAQQACPEGYALTTPSGDFADAGAGMVTHTPTGLVWKRCAEGQIWAGGTCTGSSAFYTWQGAFARADAVNAGVAGTQNMSYSDWRVPNINELQSLVEQGCFWPAINLSQFPNFPPLTEDYFWSASPVAGSSDHAWLIDFTSGGLGNIKNRIEANHIFLVRGGKSFLNFDSVLIGISQSLIDHYYQSILGRDPDPSGLSYWPSEIGRLRALGIDTQEAFRVMAGAFFASAEYVAKNTSDRQYVTDLYETFFRRGPDSGGLAYWTGQLSQGMPRSVVLFAFVFSPEFGSYMQGLFGNTASRAESYAVVDFYRGFLNRLPDSDGFSYWLNRFRSAQCQGAAAVNGQVNSISSQFLGSGEYLNRNRTNRDYVADLYYAFLRRGSDLNGFNYWTNQLDSGSQSREQLRLQFLNAAEFQNRVTQVINQGCMQ